VWGRPVPPRKGWHLTEMFEAMHRRDLRALWVFGENPAQSEANAGHAIHALQGLDHLVVQDLFLTKTAALAHVVLPGTASWCESEGTVTNSERRVQRCRKALAAPPGTMDDVTIFHEVAARLGVDLGVPTPAAAWEELRRVSPMHAGMSYARLDTLDGLQWPCPTEDHPGTTFLHAWLWDDEVPTTLPTGSRRAAFHPVDWEPVAEPPDAVFPMTLTTGRKLDAFNTGVQSGALGAPLTRHEALELGPEDAARLGLTAGARVRVVSRRGAVETVVRLDPHLRPGLCFLTFHFPHEVDTNVLTTDVWDRKAGTAEFKAAAVRVEAL
jgi:predicted molibdopterin-dependent oxidoreductase YjgC